MITRALYQGILLLHPPAFRRRFAGEMMCVFEEAALELGAVAFLFDGLLSLLRQWSINPAVWKAAGIILGNLPIVMICTLHQMQLRGGGIISASVAEAFGFAILVPLGTVALCIILSVSWFRSIRRMRG